MINLHSSLLTFSRESTETVSEKETNCLTREFKCVEKYIDYKTAIKYTPVF